MEKSFSSFKKDTTIGYALTVLGVGSLILSSFNAVNYLVGLCGAVAFIGGLVIIFRSFQGRRTWLEDHGQLVKAKIDYVSLELTATGSASIKKPLESYSMGRVHFYKIVCSPLNSKGADTDLYFSSTLAGRPKVVAGSEIDVYVDPEHPKENYWVDISQVAIDLGISANLSQLFDKFGQQSGYYRSYDGVNFEKADKV